MILCDSAAPRGVFELRAWRAGQLVEDYRDENLIVEGARDAFAALLAGGEGQSGAEIGFGTDGNGPYPSDSALTGAYTKALDGHDFPDTGQVRFQWSLSTSEANGTAIREFGLLAADGTLIARKTRGVIEKGDDISLSGTWTIIF